MKPQTKCEMCQAEQADTNWLVFFIGILIGGAIGMLLFFCAVEFFNL